jgi:hypothetical protein
MLACRGRQGPRLLIPCDTLRLAGRVHSRAIPLADYASLWLTLTYAKQRPRTSIGGLQSVLNFAFGAICAGTCTGALSLACGFACVISNLSLLTERLAI